MLMHAVTLLGCDVLHGTTIKQDPMGLNAGAASKSRGMGLVSETGGQPGLQEWGEHLDCLVQAAYHGVPVVALPFHDLPPDNAAKVVAKVINS